MKTLLLIFFLPVSVWAATQQSYELNGGLNQPVEHWQFSNAASRTGATGFFSQDIGKLGYQTDTGQYYRLIDLTPGWQLFPNAGAVTAIITDAVNSVVYPITLEHKNTAFGNTSDGVGIKAFLSDSTTHTQNAGDFKWQWRTATHNSTEAYLQIDVVSSALVNKGAVFSGTSGLSVGSTALSNTADGIIDAVNGFTIAGAAINGNKQIGDGTKFRSVAQASSQSSPTNPTGTLSTTGVMMGLAGSITTAPVTSGKVLIIISGTIFNATAIADGGKVQIRHGTGTAPTNGVALTGTADGGLVQYIAATTAEKTPFSCNAIVTGLSASTAYWIDVGLAAITGGTATITDVSISANEL